MKKNLKERIEKANVSFNHAFPVSCMPLSYYYWGASILSKKRYLNWNYNKIIERDIPKTWKKEIHKLDLANMVEQVDSSLSWRDVDEIWDDEDKKTYDEKVDEDYRLLYQLIIEPFYEIYKEEGDKKYDKTNDCERNI